MKFTESVINDTIKKDREISPFFVIIFAKTQLRGIRENYRTKQKTSLRPYLTRLSLIKIHKDDMVERR